MRTDQLWVAMLPRILEANCFMSLRQMLSDVFVKHFYTCSRIINPFRFQNDLLKDHTRYHYSIRIWINHESWNMFLLQDLIDHFAYM